MPSLSSDRSDVGGDEGKATSDDFSPSIDTTESRLRSLGQLSADCLEIRSIIEGRDLRRGRRPSMQEGCLGI